MTDTASAPERGVTRPPLLDKSQRDRALRDLMPVIEWLTAADTAFIEGAPNLGDANLHAALAALRAVPQNSPAIKAYLRWLAQNTELGLEPGVSVGPGRLP